MSNAVLVKKVGAVSGKMRGIFTCACGNNFEARVGDVKSGKTKSCGCRHYLF